MQTHRESFLPGFPRLVGCFPPPRDGAIIDTLLLWEGCRLSTSLFSRVGLRPVVFSVLNSFVLGLVRSVHFPLSPRHAHAGPAFVLQAARACRCPPSAGALVWLRGLQLSPSWSMGPVLDGGSSTSCLRLPFPLCQVILSAPFSRPQILGCLFVQTVVFPYLFCATKFFTSLSRLFNAQEPVLVSSQSHPLTIYCSKEPTRPLKCSKSCGVE